MFPLWKKIATICLLVLSLLYISFRKNIFFWGNYMEHIIVLIIIVISIISLIASIIIHTTQLKRSRSGELMNNWLYLQEEQKKKKKLLPVIYLLVIIIIVFFLWIGRFIFNEFLLMTKDLSYVLNRDYPKVECFIKSNDFTYQKGYRHVQYITAINKANKEYMYINFEHDYEKIYEYSNYIIWYLPNTKLGVKAEKLP